MQSSKYLFLNNAVSSEQLNRLPRDLKYLYVNNICITKMPDNLPHTLKYIIYHNAFNVDKNLDILKLDKNIDKNKFYDMFDHYYMISESVEITNWKIPFGCKIIKSPKKLLIYKSNLNFENDIMIFQSNIMRLPQNSIEINYKKSLVLLYTLFNKLIGKNKKFLSNTYGKVLYQENINTVYYGFKSIINLDSDSDSDSD